jgi:hypothetical protein
VPGVVGNVKELSDEPERAWERSAKEIYDTCEVAVLFAVRVDLSIPGGNLTGVP